jgi:exonuclease VII large subunit
VSNATQPQDTGKCSIIQDSVADCPKILTGARKGEKKMEIVGFRKGIKKKLPAEQNASNLRKQQEKTDQRQDHTRFQRRLRRRISRRVSRLRRRVSKKAKRLKQSRHSAESLYKGFRDVRVERKGMRVITSETELSEIKIVPLKTNPSLI